MDYNIRVITFMGGDAYNLDERIIRLRFHNRKIYRNVILTCFVGLLKFYSKKENRPDIVNPHIGIMGLPTIPIARLYNIKIIVSEHFNHVYQEQNILRKILWNYLYKRADSITILTNFDLPFFSKKNKKTVVMENPCSFDVLNANIKYRDLTILAIGSLNRYVHKGFDTLIKVVSKVLPQFPDWNLKIIGEGDMGKKYLENIANEFNVSEQIQFLGYRSDVKEIMSTSEIFILSSRYEGLPMVLLEALSQKMACISFDCITGPSEIIQNNINGLLVEDQNMEEMTLKLTELITNESLRRKLQKNAPNALDKYSIEKVGKKWMKLFEEISNNN
jgi:glycosyltransferase involved in cell wall biosynthesis